MYGFKKYNIFTQFYNIQNTIMLILNNIYSNKNYQ